MRFIRKNAEISMDGAWSTQTGKRQCHITGNWKGDYPWGLQACLSRIIDLVHHLCHLWVGARCFWVGRVLFVSLKFWMQSEDAQAIFVGASDPTKLDPAGGALFISHKRRIVGNGRACKGGNTKFIGLLLFNNFVIGNDIKTFKLETNLARIKPE